MAVIFPPMEDYSSSRNLLPRQTLSELRDGTQYCSNGADQFMIPLMPEYRTKYPSLPLYLRSDSGFPHLNCTMPARSMIANIRFG